MKRLLVALLLLTLGAGTSEKGRLFILKLGQGAETQFGVAEWKTTGPLPIGQFLEEWGLSGAKNWTFLGLLVDNEKGRKPLSWCPMRQPVTMVWKVPGESGQHQASCVDIEMEIVVRLATNEDEVPDELRPLFRQVFGTEDVMPGVLQVRVLVFKTAKPVPYKDITAMWMVPERGKKAVQMEEQWRALEPEGDEPTED